jgi:phosphohistidine phosphatase
MKRLTWAPMFLLLALSFFTSCRGTEEKVGEATERNLYLCRHAKGKKLGPNKEDIDRGLTKKGKITAQLMGAYLAKEPPIDLIVSSTADRALATAKKIALALDYPLGKLRREPSLYKCPTHNLLAYVRNLPDSIQNICFVLHNPTAEQGINHYQKDTIVQKVKPGTVAHIKFHTIDWCDATHKTGKFIDYKRFKAPEIGK